MSYSRYSDPFEPVSNFLRRNQIPVTLSLIAISALLFLVDFFDRGIALNFIYAAPPFAPIDLFSMFAYPLMDPAFISVVFACLILSWCGGSLERSWGSIKFALFFFALTLITAFGLTLGGLLLRTTAEIVGMWIPLTCLIVAWATINPSQTVMIYGILPIQARWIAIFYVGVIYFVNYYGAPLLGLFALLGPLAAFLVVQLGVMSGSGYRPPRGPDLRIINSGGRSRNRPLDDAGITMSLNPINRLRAWQQRRRLAKLLQKSGFTERDDDQRRR